MTTTLSRPQKPSRGMCLVPGVIYEWTPGGMKPADDREFAAAQPTPLRSGSEVVPGYHLAERIGAGCTGEVWRAIGPGGVPVALKFIEACRPEAWQELRSLAMRLKIRHANLIGIFGVWNRQDWAVIGMDLADGSLGDRFEAVVRHGKPGLDFAELAVFLHQAARGIDFLNEPRHPLPRVGPVGLVHRDIKPQNLLIVGGSVKVGDLGLVTRWDVPDAALRPSSQALKIHVTDFMSPEVRRGRPSRQSDQYSLAASYCYLRSGLVPMPGPGVLREAGESGIHSAPDLTMLPVWERPAVARALAIDPAHRWVSCVAFVEALIGSVGLDDQGTNPIAPPVVSPPIAPTRSRRALRVMAGAAPMILVLTGLWSQRDKLVSDPPNPLRVSTPTSLPAAAEPSDDRSPADSLGTQITAIEPAETSSATATIEAIRAGGGDDVGLSPPESVNHDLADQPPGEVESAPIGPMVAAAAQSWAVGTWDRLHGGLASARDSLRPRLATFLAPIAAADAHVVAAVSPRSTKSTGNPDAAPASTEAPSPRPASIVVRMPSPKAELVVRGEVGRGHPDEWYGPSRVIHTPPLLGPQDYLVGAFWAEPNGERLSRSLPVRIEPGRRYEIDLRVETPTLVVLPPPPEF